jgi:RecB family exonuclease
LVLHPHRGSVAAEFRSSEPVILNVTDLRPSPTGEKARPAAVMPGSRRGSERLLGTVVHRLCQRALSPSLERDAIARIVPTLVRPAEMVDVEDREAFAGRAAELFTRVRAREDVAALLRSGQCLYEVPFTFASPERPDSLVRGIIDCVVIHPDGGATILEFKTGMPRSEHQDQVALYASALRSVLGTGAIDLKIVYA